MCIAVDNSSGLCPQGWHVPTVSEYSDLATELGSNPAAKLKETGTVHWSSESTGTSNSSGFTARPAGLRSAYNGTYGYLKTNTYFWTSTTSSSNATYLPLTVASSGSLPTYNTTKNYGFSVRCLEDN